ncbi:MAG: hypothetical protein IKO77_01070 [Bacteroidales bacterium]|nr:hypothetical protein [Bacteroidales bacterium]
MKKQYILLTALLFAFTACSVEPVEVIPAGSKVVINAYNEGAADTRTCVQPWASVWLKVWEPEVM